MIFLRGNVDKVKFLLEKGANPNHRATTHVESLDMTPLTWCTYGNHILAVEEFLNDERTDINFVVRSEDSSHLTALDIAYKINDGTNFDLVNLMRRYDAKKFEELLVEYKTECAIPGMPPSYLKLLCNGESEQLL